MHPREAKIIELQRRYAKVAERMFLSLETHDDKNQDFQHELDLIYAEILKLDRKEVQNG